MTQIEYNLTLRIV